MRHSRPLQQLLDISVRTAHGPQHEQQFADAQLSDGAPFLMEEVECEEEEEEGERKEQLPADAAAAVSSSSAAAAAAAPSGMGPFQRVRVEWGLPPTPSDDLMACPQTCLS